MGSDLTAGDERVIRLRGFAMNKTPFHATVMRPLVARGIFRRVERKGFMTRWDLTEAGERIYTNLTSKDNK